jgi:hypothetical protein
MGYLGEYNQAFIFFNSDKLVINANIAGSMGNIDNFDFINIGMVMELETRIMNGLVQSR